MQNDTRKCMYAHVQSCTHIGGALTILARLFTLCVVAATRIPLTFYFPSLLFGVIRSARSAPLQFSAYFFLSLLPLFYLFLSYWYPLFPFSIFFLLLGFFLSLFLFLAVFFSNSRTHNSPHAANVAARHPAKPAGARVLRHSQKTRE